jgi:hypothetical protein
MSAIFSQNKYTTWYLSIITQAKLKVNLRVTGYYEKHHIIPRCLDGGGGENIIKLSAREHFICHRLLTKMFIEKSVLMKMHCAMHYLMRNRNDNLKITSKTFAVVRENFSKAMSQIMKGKRRIQSDEEKRLRSINQLGRYVSEETKQKISSAHLGKTHQPHSRETRAKISAVNIGKKASPEMIAHNSAAIKLKFATDDSYRARVSQGVSRANTGKVWVTRDGKNRFTTREESLKLLADGWSIGRSKHYRRPASQETIEKIKLAKSKRPASAWHVL